MLLSMAGIMHASDSAVHSATREEQAIDSSTMHLGFRRIRLSDRR